MVTSAIKKNSAEKGNEAGEQVAFFSFFFGRITWHVELPQPGMETHTPCSGSRVLTTGTPRMSQITILNKVAKKKKVARERLTEMIFEQRPERDEDFSYEVIWQNSILDRGNSKCKGLKVETALYGGMCNGEERRGNQKGNSKLDN